MGRHNWRYEEEGTICWRRAGNIPPAAKAICSPFDLQAHYSIKRRTEWTGYKAHFTETCESDAPHLIVHVITTSATQQDSEVIAELHQALTDKDLLPDEHLLDQGYSDSHDLIQAHKVYDIEMLMPMRTDHAWQSQVSDGYDLSCFRIDWEVQQVHCPQEKTSASWRGGYDKQDHPRIEVMFNTSDCVPCLARLLCTKSKRQRRKLTFRPQSEHELIQAARAYQQTREFKDRYAARAGIEGTISQAVSALDMRRSRYRGHPKTHLQHVVTAVAINIKRTINWLNDVPFAETKPSRFAALMSA